MSEEIVQVDYAFVKSGSDIATKIWDELQVPYNPAQYQYCHSIYMKVPVAGGYEQAGQVARKIVVDWYRKGVRGKVEYHRKDLKECNGVKIWDVPKDYIQQLPRKLDRGADLNAHSLSTEGIPEGQKIYDIEEMIANLHPCYKKIREGGINCSDIENIAYAYAAYLKRKKVKKETVLMELVGWDEKNVSKIGRKAIHDLVDRVWRSNPKMYGCEALRNYQPFEEACTESCKLRKKELKKEKQEEVYDFLVDMTEKVTAYVGEDNTYFHFTVQNPKEEDKTFLIKLDQDTLLNSKEFGKQYLAKTLDISRYHIIAKLSDDDWEAYSNTVFEDLEVGDITDLSGDDVVHEEIVKRRLARLLVSSKLKEVVEGLDGVYYDEVKDHFWVPLNNVRTIMQQEKIKETTNRMKGLLGDAIIRTEQKRLGEQVINGWVLYKECFCFARPLDDEDEEQDSVLGGLEEGE